MKQHRLLACLIGLFSLLVFQPFFPSCPILALSPLIVFYLLHTSLLTTLWTSFSVGLLIDLLSSSHMGLNALNFFLTSFLLYKQRKHFIKDNPYNLSLFTAIYSSLWALLYSLLIFLFDRRILFHGKWVVTDLMIMPALDGLYAYLCFTLPFALLDKMQKRIQAKKLSKDVQS